MPANPSQVESIFLAAIEKAPAQRIAFLAEACGGDADLRRQVEDELTAHDEQGSHLAQPDAAGNAAPVLNGECLTVAAETSVYKETPQRIGPYKLLQKIGVGGMGIVYMAEQEHPVRRRVAIKIIKPGMDSAQVIARFEAERQALALMDHVNIARVLDAGATEAGLPYFVMELIQGVWITSYCDDNCLTPRERMELFVPVCQAIQHAHTKGIIHRDVKPSNVLVTMYDGRPVPKVIDFGVAKATEQRLTDRTLFTQYGATVGTFEYMAPEQAELSTLGVDTRSDIYSLGAMLYELLTGVPPLGVEQFKQAGFTEKLRMIRDFEPVRPSAQLSSSESLPAAPHTRKSKSAAELVTLVKGDLDWIVMKCLEKDRTRRYETANGLARDIQRYLADEPVEACPPSASYRLRRFVRKHRKALAAAAGFVLLLLLSVVVSTWQAVRAARAAQNMEIAFDRAQLALAGQVAERLEGEVRQMAILGDTLEATLAQRGDWTDHELKVLLGDLLDRDPRIRGITLAFEREKIAREENYCLCVYRNPEGRDRGHKTTQLLFPPGHPRGRVLYRDWHWYNEPLNRGAMWIGPGLDEGVYTVSYCRPMRRWGKKRNVGVLTVDLQAEDFNRLWDWLEKLNLGKQSYGFVVCGAGTANGVGNGMKGTFMGHPKYQTPMRITDPKLEEEIDPAFNELTQRILSGKAGTAKAIDPTTGKRSAFLFAPVPSAGWMIVAVIEQTAEDP